MNRRVFMELFGIGTAGAAAKLSLPSRREPVVHPPTEVGKLVYLCEKPGGVTTITPPAGSTTMSMGKIIAFHEPGGATILVTPMGGTNVRVVL